jgi:hypothetical protein
VSIEFVKPSVFHSDPDVNSLHWYLAIVYNPGALIPDVIHVEDDTQQNDESSMKTDSGDSINLEEDAILARPGQNVSHIASNATTIDESGEKSDQMGSEESSDNVVELKEDKSEEQESNENESEEQEDSKRSAPPVDSEPSEASEDEGEEPATQEDVAPMEVSASPELSATPSHSNSEDMDEDVIVEIKVSKGTETSSQEFMESPQILVQDSNGSTVELLEEGSVPPPMMDTTDDAVEVHLSSSSSGNNDEVLVRRTPRRKANERENSPELIVSPDPRPSKRRKSAPMDIEKKMEKEAEREVKFQAYLQQ